jgi:hypothetical protein
VVGGRGRGRLAVVVGALLAAGMAGCKLDRVNVAEGRDGLVVHAIIDSKTFLVDVLVERTLTGRVDVRPATPDTINPVVAGGGIPVSEAQVTITRLSDGRSARGCEGAIIDSLVVSGRDTVLTPLCVQQDGHPWGRGVYHFHNRGEAARTVFWALPMPRGDSYRLDVAARTGETVSAVTMIPTFIRANPQILVRATFDRERDSIVVTYPAIEGQERFLFRVQTPYGPYSLFTDSSRLVVRGSLRNATDNNIPPAFLPGFRQGITVGAVDQNYFDYYRTSNSQFTGLGLLSHLDGASGVFGSVATAFNDSVTVTAPFRDPADGRFVGGAGGRDTLELWMLEDVKGGRLVSGDLVAYDGVNFGYFRAGILGTLVNGRLALDVLRRDTADDVVYHLSGSAATAASPTLTLARSGGGTLTFRRIAP